MNDFDEEVWKEIAKLSFNLYGNPSQAVKDANKVVEELWKFNPDRTENGGFIARKLREMSEWQSIETAPEGERVLLRWGNLGGHVEDGFLQDGTAVLFDGELFDTYPSHWTPIPLLPEEE